LFISGSGNGNWSARARDEDRRYGAVFGPIGKRPQFSPDDTHSVVL